MADILPKGTRIPYTTPADALFSQRYQYLIDSVLVPVTDKTPFPQVEGEYLVTTFSTEHSGYRIVVVEIVDDAGRYIVYERHDTDRSPLKLAVKSWLKLGSN